MHRYRFCVEFCAGKDVLDLGCAEGHGSALVASHAHKLWGVDASAEAIALAQATHQAKNLQFMRGSGTAIPLPDASVDVAIAFETIVNAEVLREVRRVLRPNGLLITSSADRQRAAEDGDDPNRARHTEDFAALLQRQFAKVATYAQKIEFDPVTQNQNGEGKPVGTGVEDSESPAHLSAPMTRIALASDSADWFGADCTEVTEAMVFHSADGIEATSVIAKQETAPVDATGGPLDGVQALAEATQLKGQIADPGTAGSGSEPQAGDLSYHLTPPAPPGKRSRFNRMGFHASGRPRGWLRFLLLRDQKLGTPRPMTQRLLFKKSGAVRPVFRDWYNRYEISPENAEFYSYTQMLREQKNLDKAKTVCVVCTPHTIFIAEAVAQALAGTRLDVTYVTEMPRAFTHDLYVVIAAQMFDRMPPLERCFLFQMEQVRASRWVDGFYLGRLRGCLGVIDYAFDNITALIERGLLLKQLFYVPIQPFAKPKALTAERDIDVLFYGAQGSPRRDRYLAALSKRVKVRVETNLFGDQITDLLSRAKVVVNIHYYENALLETTRLSEALSHGAFVVSEQSSDHLDQTDFDDLVDFVASGDVEAFVRQVEARLQQWSSAQIVKTREDVGSMKFMLLRALHGCGVLSFAEFAQATRNTDLPSDRLVLGLPEEATRRRSAQENRLPGFAAFPGLRHVDGWKGCAQSYKYMASKAQAADLPRLTICEDDAVFAPGTAQRFAIITDYLDQQTQSWDVFSGLLSDLHDDAEISAVVTYQGETLVHLNSVIGMVFGLYNRLAIETLAGFEFAGDDIRQHTIDRYFEATKPRCITTVPPVAMQSIELESTLWLAHNQSMTDMIAASLSLLEKKIEAFSQADGQG